MKMEVLTVQNQFQSHQFGAMKHPKVEGEFRGYSRKFYCRPASSSAYYNKNISFVVVVVKSTEKYNIWLK